MSLTVNSKKETAASLIYSLYSKTSVTANDGAWHHICLGWESPTGLWMLYKDGEEKWKGEDFRTDYTIKRGGTLVLGQEQDSVGGGFEAVQSFQGMISNVNIWDTFLSASKIKEMSKSCLLDEENDGNVYKWRDFLRRGGVKLVKPTPCKPFKTLGK